VMASTVGIYDVAFSGNQFQLLARKMYFQAAKFMFWGRFKAFNTKGGMVDPEKSRQVFNSPIVVHQELNKLPGNQLQVPMLRRLVNLPKYGRTQLSGHEEEQKVNHLAVYIDIIRHAVKTKESSLTDQILKSYNLVQQAEPQLRQYFAELQNFMEIPAAIYKGKSLNVLGGEAASTLAAWSHPHIYVAGSGKVSSSGVYPGTTAYENAVATAIDNVGVSHVFNTDFLNALKAEPQIRKIPMLATVEGESYRVIIAHQWQIKDLQEDSKFQQVVAQTAAEKFAKNNPMLIGCKWFWNGWAIFDAGEAIWPVTTSSSLPVWGPSSAASDITSYQDWSGYEVFGAIILGDNAIAEASGKPLEFIGETRDYKEVEGVGFRTLVGWARADFWNNDEGSTGQYLVNDTSAIAITRAMPAGY